MKRTILIFGGLAVAVWLLFELSKFSLAKSESFNEIYLVAAGCLFIIIGFILHKLLRRETATQTANEGIDNAQLKKTGLTEREYETLQLLSKGLSNQEIADQLFVSENTVKTHVSKTLMKLNAKRRTQAVQIARDLNII